MSPFGLHLAGISADLLPMEIASADKKWDLRPWTLPFIVVACFAFGWFFGADRILLLNDEGIYLSDARRLLNGDVPYRDFFLITGPGNAVMYAAVMKVFGFSLAASRSLLFLELALLTALVYWLTERLASVRTAAVAAFCFFAFTVADSKTTQVNHRWDSGLCATAAIVVLYAAVTGGLRARWMLLAGALAAAAAWFTPPVLLVCGGLLVWLAMYSRRSIVPYLGGVALVSVPAIGALAATGALMPMIDQLLWNARNYSGANWMQYGSVVGGWSSIFAGFGGLELVIVTLLVMVLALPAILPVLAVLGVPLRVWRGPHELFLVAAAVTLAVTAYPRLEVQHLQFVSAIPYALGFVFCSRLLPPPFRLGVGLTAAVLACSYLSYPFLSGQTEQQIETCTGPARGTREEARLLHAIGRHVPSGASMFAFPYIPKLHYLTCAVNPTRYGFMQPGMSAENDERSVIAALDRDQTEWLAYVDASPQAYLKIWPSSDPSRLHLRLVEDYIARNYETVLPAQPKLGIELKRRRRVPLAAR